MNPMLILYVLITALGAKGDGVWFPTLDAIATGKIPPPQGFEGMAVGMFPNLASPLRDSPGIFSKHMSNQNQQQLGYQHQHQQYNQQQLDHQQNQQKVRPSDPIQSPNSDRVAIATVDVEEIRREIDSLREVVKTPSHARDGSTHALLASKLQLLDLRAHSGGLLNREALQHYETAIQLGVPEESKETLFLNMGMLHSWMGNLEKAVEFYSNLLLLALPPSKQAEAFNHRADAYSNMGHFAEAAADHRGALAAVPSDATAWAGLTQILKEHPNSEGEATDWNQVASDLDVALEKAKHRNDLLSMTKLGFAQFTAHHFSGHTAEAWQHLHNANTLEFSRHQQEYQQRKSMQLQQLENSMRIFKRGAWIDGVGSKEKTPVFIIGMMRSGSSVTEQILASHDQVFGGGEDSVFGSVSDVIVDRISAAVGAGSLEALSSAVELSGAEVVAGMMKAVPKERESVVTRVVDKQLFNFKQVGLIHLVFPDAVIIETTRNFMDVLFSIYRFYFNEVGLSWSFSLREIVEYYILYLRTMNHWKTELPLDRILTVRYEDLVTNQEDCARMLLDRLRLPWDPKVIKFHETERYVNTMSAAQVRRPMNAKGVNAWRKYEVFLMPALDDAELTLSLSSILGYHWRHDPPYFKDINPNGFISEKIEADSISVDVIVDTSAVLEDVWI